MKGPPPKRSFNNPSGPPVRFGHHLEAFHTQDSTDHLNCQLISGFDAGQKIDPIEALISQNGLQPCEPLAQRRED